MSLLNILGSTRWQKYRKEKLDTYSPYLYNQSKMVIDAINENRVAITELSGQTGQMFIRVGDGTEESPYRIQANYDLYSVGSISAYGLYAGGESGGGISYNRLDSWVDYTPDKVGYVLSAYLGNDLNTRVIDLANTKWTKEQALIDHWNTAYSFEEQYKTLLSYFSIVDGKIQVSTDIYSLESISAYGLGPGSSPATSISNMVDVLLTNLTNDQVLVFNSTSNHWENVSVSSLKTDLTGYATQTYVGQQIANLVNQAPSTLDTLNELATALGDDPNFATTITTLIGTKWAQDDTKIQHWDLAYANNHTHSNKTLLDEFSEADANVLNHLFVQDGKLYTDVDFYSNASISAYGLGPGGSEGSSIFTAYSSWGGSRPTDNTLLLSAPIAWDLYAQVQTMASYSYLPISGGTLTGPLTIQGNVTAPSFIKEGGTADQFLKADGSTSTIAVSTEDAIGILRISTLSESLAGLDDTTAMSPLKVYAFGTTTYVPYNEALDDMDLGDFKAMMTALILHPAPLVSTPISGMMEFDGSDFYISI